MEKRFIKGHWYKVKDYWGHVWTGEYMGREEDMTCCVCYKGNHAYCFNHWNGADDYETFPFGKEHMPEMLEDLGRQENIIID